MVQSIQRVVLHHVSSDSYVNSSRYVERRAKVPVIFLSDFYVWAGYVFLCLNAGEVERSAVLKLCLVQLRNGVCVAVRSGACYCVAKKTVHVFDLILNKDYFCFLAGVVYRKVEGGDLESISTGVWVAWSLKISTAVCQIEALNEVYCESDSEHPVVVRFVSKKWTPIRRFK